MNFETIFFFFFSSIALTSAIFVIYSTNTIYSAFFLILVFVNSTGLLLISEIEFISIMLIIIYVGAITVLFLFVIMMLDINVLIDKNNNNNFGYLPIIFLISFVFFLETFVMFSKIFTTYYHLIEQSFFKNDLFYNQVIYQLDNITNIETIGQILYSYYAFFFLAAGIILLIALIGAVTLTKKEKKKQNFLTKNLYKQLSRNSLQAVFNIKNKN
jgi:NADH-quinone oxidoreductase subunit J|uniref:NADH-ubiquinone oxidoreductase chain 6 n=1 Tax=Globisporangium ultimum TaxID=2052682 RepID=D8WJ64_GLOUL|nr:NADH dehydrogenase subunit 6 [Globisporangium ultimum]YP_003734870.1 NADH dehydrogenase subunit 6 [Globisporangium ultimum]ACZ43846.1 NADH dehydrogenase subunit 6 [Globisporangium ultimum]ACZ43905.1 NADH dehydrogenase subunit 6 [Globisporangium ultimum]ACZ44428.1 NADH dehydrogenase subunit 6 [Globisporangium ultimum]ACZ44487.1 NADH dehydrogenase subunit 6 [Globisporangium ultimum]